MSHWKNVGGFALCAALTFSLSDPGLAGSCGYEYCWGAVAAGENGVAARASGFRTAPDAWTRADRVCQQNCKTIEVFSNGCGAIAQNSDEAMFAGFAESRSAAESEVLALCDKQDGGVCRVRISACSK